MEIMDPERRAKYEKLLRETREDIHRIEAQIEKELAAVKERLQGLQEEKKAQLTIYSGYFTLCSHENEFEQEE